MTNTHKLSMVLPNLKGIEVRAAPPLQTVSSNTSSTPIKEMSYIILSLMPTPCAEN